MPRLLIGQELDGKPFTVDPVSLTKHTIVFGATGSGKTVLCKSIIEEASSRGVPILAIDPKGDIGCLGIRSEQFKFRPYSDIEAKLLGKPAATYEAEIASEYRNNCLKFGLAEDDVKKFVGQTEVKVYTPRSNNGFPVSMSPRLTPPKEFARKMEEEPSLALDLLDLKASNLLRLAGYSDDSIVQRSLITRILEEEWKNGHELTLEGLIELVATPPFDKLGMLPLDEAIGKRERSELSKRLNVLVTDAGTKAWFIGEPPDFDRWFRRSEGRTPICVVDLRSIPNEQGKQIFVEYLLQELFYWLTRQEGTQTLQYLLYFDEIHGYCPPVREPPSKKILMHLIHVSRAYGLGIVMATQNPSDVDYKVISNANFRFIGNLSTRQDIERVKTGLSLGSEAFQTISSLKTRQFYYQIFDQGVYGILVPRWLMSYHRGPLEPGEVKRLRMGVLPEKLAVRILTMSVPEQVLLGELEKKRKKGGLFRGPEEKVWLARTLYLPYLEFSYRYSVEKGLVSKQRVINEGRSVMLALREANLGFQPELLQLVSQLIEADVEPSSVISGVDSTALLAERLDSLKKLLSQQDAQIEQLSRGNGSTPKKGTTRNQLRVQLYNLKKTRESTWKVFSEGLGLPSKLDLNNLELVNGSLFYIPYFIAKLSRGRESRFLVWDRSGKENGAISAEMVRNPKLRDLAESHATP